MLPISVSFTKWKDFFLKQQRKACFLFAWNCFLKFKLYETDLGEFDLASSD